MITNKLERGGKVGPVHPWTLAVLQTPAGQENPADKSRARRRRCLSSGLSSSSSYCASNNNEAINTQVKLSRFPGGRRRGVPAVTAVANEVAKLRAIRHIKAGI